jgi:hypothetical protein
MLRQLVHLLCVCIHPFPLSDAVPFYQPFAASDKVTIPRLLVGLVFHFWVQHSDCQHKVQPVQEQSCCLMARFSFCMARYLAICADKCKNNPNTQTQSDTPMRSAPYSLRKLDLKHSGSIGKTSTFHCCTQYWHTQKRLPQPAAPGADLLLAPQPESKNVPSIPNSGSTTIKHNPIMICLMLEIIF